MTRRALRALAALGLTALVVTSMAACASRPVDAAGSGDGDTGAEDLVLDAAWLDGGRMIGIVTQGSSTCVPTAGAALDGDVLAVSLQEPAADTPCTMDFVPRVSLVDVPDGVDPAQDLEITVTGAGQDGSIQLAGVEGLAVDGEYDMTPSAGWTSLDGTFIVLLWGSSSCPEYITSTEVTGGAGVTASLSGIPADKVCTADIAPNAVLADADGLQGVPDVELTLTSASAEAVVIPILGVNDTGAPLG